jgi:pimeloyl-ACP methyl ester carboxylesterase
MDSAGMLQPSVAESNDGCRIAYWSGGNRAGLPIVLLHGFSLDHSVWSAVCAQYGFLDRCHVVVPDLRGHGKSERPLAADGYVDGRAWADDLDAVIRASGLERPAVVAWSYGGRMLFDYVRYHGTRSLRCLNLVAAASLADPVTLGPDHTVLADLCSRQTQVEQAAAERFMTEVLRIGRGTEMYEACSAAMRSVSVVQRGWLRSRPLDYDRIVAELDLPVLVTHGASDSVVLPVHAANLQNAIPGAWISHYEDAGHAPFLDDPVRFASELIAFVAQAS